MLRDFRLYLDDILEAIHQIRTYLADQDEEAFKKDRKTQDAIIRNLEIIGEAAGKLPENMQKDEPEIDWRKISRPCFLAKPFRLNAATKSSRPPLLTSINNSTFAGAENM
jgi:hypothetical protein